MTSAKPKVKSASRERPRRSRSRKLGQIARPEPKPAKSGPSSNACRQSPSAPPEPPALTHPEIRTIVLGIMLAMFLGALDQTIVATALPTIGRHFGNIGDLSWVVTAYLLTATAVTPLYGKLADIHGRRVLMLDRRSASSSPARSPARWRRA